MQQGYRPTALERRHPGIVARKRKQARAILEQERYSMGECIACGFRLDDVSLSAGFVRCGECASREEES